MIDRNDLDGWTFDVASNRAIFAGSACAQLNAGTVSDIDIVYGCPEPVS